MIPCLHYSAPDFLASITQAERESSAGSGWFNMAAPEMTEELEQDLEVIRARGADGGYKKSDYKDGPKYFQVTSPTLSSLTSLPYYKDGPKYFRVTSPPTLSSLTSLPYYKDGPKYFRVTSPPTLSSLTSLPDFGPVLEAWAEC